MDWIRSETVPMNQWIQWVKKFSIDPWYRFSRWNDLSSRRGPFYYGDFFFAFCLLLVGLFDSLKHYPLHHVDTLTSTVGGGG